MRREIVGYRNDEEGHWVALLDCGHPQHVRHHPPLKSRPWVLTEAGRRAHLGTRLNCARCDDFELPADFIAYKKTPVFTEETMPPALRQEHSTRPGVWVRLVIQKGRLRYQVPLLKRNDVLTPKRAGLIIPGVPHHIEPLGAVQFFLEFFAKPHPPEPPAVAKKIREKPER